MVYQSADMKVGLLTTW